MAVEADPYSSLIVSEGTPYVPEPPMQQPRQRMGVLVRENY